MANGLIKSFFIKYFQFSDFMSGLKHDCYTIAPLGNTSLLTVDASGSVFPYTECKYGGPLGRRPERVMKVRLVRPWCFVLTMLPLKSLASWTG